MNFPEKLGIAATHGLRSIGHLRALLHLAEFGPMSLAALSPVCRVSSAAITAMADKLQSDGYVTESADPKDRRKRILSLTPTGRELTTDLLG